ncbi:hypothetical protein M407DRAFT_30173 [Tulasnella calospora MUT 4182]|uniref:Uncharacterized protein n=1 Tax=Tulasnella calospora MUT 4182 TaxID=1051891 RepID=A0A0C3Q7R3_9AGAM|nr:hypothetical protein M407DRAFT_30173 [Tulasnella calospora MUT 4182]
MVTFHHKKEVTLSKGASGLVKEIILDDDDLPEAIILKLDHPPSGLVEGFVHGEIPIPPSTNRFRIQSNNDKSLRITVTRHQYGLVPAFSLTDYKSQGQTIDHVIVDIGNPGTGNISQFNAGIDKDLAEEDSRLEQLNEVTKAQYEKLVLSHVEAQKGVAKVVGLTPYSDP